MAISSIGSKNLLEYKIAAVRTPMPKEPSSTRNPPKSKIAATVTFPMKIRPGS